MGLFEVRVQLPFKVQPEDGHFVSICPALQVYSQGPDEAKALSNLEEAVTLFIESCYERGTLNQVMKDCGFYQTQPHESTDDKYIDVSVPFAVNVEETVTN